jgi:hypothetical protein
MNAIRIHKQIDSETLHLPEIRPLIGKTVEIIVLEDSPVLAEKRASGSRYAAFFALAGTDVVDPNALRELRSASAL